MTSVDRVYLREGSSDEGVTSLPDGFDALERFVPEWVLEDTTTRMHKRCATSFVAITEFYDAMLQHADKGVEYLRGRQLGEMTPEEERLLKLFLSLMEVGPCIEWFGAPTGIDDFDHTRFIMPLPVSDTAAQL